MPGELILSIAALFATTAAVAALVGWYIRYTSYTHDWRCTGCGHVFAIPPREALQLSSHLPSSPMVTCPSCRNRVPAEPVPKARY